MEKIDNDNLVPRLHIDPPLFNSANPWATTLGQLRDLYACDSTGAVTTRTALLGQGFPHDDGVHRYAFFEAAAHRISYIDGRGGEGKGIEEDGEEKEKWIADASLNTLGYSPIPLDTYLEYIRVIDEVEQEENQRGVSRDREADVGKQGKRDRRRKPFIVSVTGTLEEVAECYLRISRAAGALVAVGGLAMEVNLSCPNIPGKPPPAYDAEALGAYLRRIAAAAASVAVVDTDGESKGEVPWGVKTPPYTHAGQFEMLVKTLKDCAVPRRVKGNERCEDEGTEKMVCPLSFVTATNTLGSCLLLDADWAPALPGLGVGGLGVGGLAGAPLHPLALGNVATIRRMLDEHPETRHVAVLGIGGVDSAAAYKRMRSVGAQAVGVGTALGVRGLGVFGEIERELGGAWDV